MSASGFLLDENMTPELSRAVQRRSSDIVVVRVGDVGAPPLGTLDPDILVWCETNEYWLVTRNRKSMPPHLTAHIEAGRHVPGIFVITSEMSLGQIVNDLELI